MTTRRTGSYEYNVICDVCGFKFKASELLRRWDGPMVCKDDYESRNILDFFRTRNDAHTLPYIRTDNQEESTWSVILTNIGGSISSEEGSYTNRDGTVHFTVQITPVTGNYSTSTSGQVSIPLEATSDGTVRVTDSAGRFLGTGTILTGNTVADVPDWAANYRIINISGTYGA